MNSMFKVTLLCVALLLPGSAAVSIAAPTDERGFADLTKKVSPGVVNISTYARPRMQGRPGLNGDDLFRRFFEEFYGGRMPPGRREQNPDAEGPVTKGKPVPMGLGSGFVVDAAEGLILTNDHVIQGAEEVKIQFKEEDAELIPAEIVGRDPELDIALLKIKSKSKLTALPLGDSDAIDVGEYVLAIGNPLGYGHTVTHGILSAKGRRNPEFRLGKYLQTDASINPGNSGGPLLNMKGEVIGINNAIDARGQAIGFAIPINSVKSVLNQLKTKGSVSRGYLGVSAADLTPEFTEQLKMDPKLKGVLISDIGPGTPAAKAGLKPYDVITAINGEKVTNATDLTAKVVAVPVGGTVEITYVRNGKERSVKTQVAERPVNGVAKRRGPPEKKPGSMPTAQFDEYGFQAVEVDSAGATELGLPPDAISSKGVVVSDLEYGKAAAQAGLGRGDLILDVAGKTVQTLGDLQSVMKRAGSKSLMIRVRRFDPQGGSAVMVVVLTP